MEYRKHIESIFGIHAFDHALFYQYKEALRFELSLGGSAIEMFTTAWRRVEEILASVLDGEDDLYACWSFYGSGTYLSSLSAFREVTGCGVKIPKLREAWSAIDDEDEEYFRHFILFKMSSSTAKNLIWGALAQDLGIRPRIVGKVHLFNLTRNVAIHPYDDRGMDIYSTDVKFMRSVFDRFNDYLLDYDRAIMEDVYGAL